MVGIAYYFFVQFYILTIFHVRISHTVGLYNVFSLFKFNMTVQSVSFQTKSTELAARLTDGRRQMLRMEIMDGKLQKVNYG